MNEKIGIFLSIFSSDEVENSISYIYSLCVNIKAYNIFYERYPNVSLIVNTDDFTKRIIYDVCHQEKIELDKTIFHLHRRNSGLRGMFWRFESFYSDEYDITVNGEGDYCLDTYFKQLEYFEHQNNPIMFFVVRQSEINYNAFDGARIFIRPKLIEQSIKQKIKSALELFEHIDDIDYGVDERYLREILLNYFKETKNILIINNKLRIKDAIVDFSKEKEYLCEIFINSHILSISELDVIVKEYNKYIFNTKELDYLITTNSNKKCYCLYGRCLKLKEPFRVSRSEFCQVKLIDIIKKLI